jgi:hypothetical protein
MRAADYRINRHTAKKFASREAVSLSKLAQQVADEVGAGDHADDLAAVDDGL